MPKVRRSFRDPQYEAPTYKDALERIGANLRRMRKDRGWSQADAAQRLGMKPQQFHQLESRGNNTTLVTLARIADAFGADISELLAPILPTQAKAE